MNGLSLNHMVEYKDPVLTRTFAALADPTRRSILAQLETQASLPVSKLAKPYPISLPAIIKHLEVLAEAGLILRSKSGRTVTCRLNAAPMADAAAWLGRYERFWSGRLDRLAAIVEEDHARSSIQNQTQPHP